MKISVIIPTYKPGEYIFDCLLSLERQTIDKHLFEVVIVLNGPKEPFFDIIKNYISKLQLYSKLYYSERIGVSNARNIALQKIHSNYVAFIDDDDVVSAKYLEGLFMIADIESIVISNSRTFKDNIGQTGKDYTALAYDRIKNRKKVSLIKGRRFFSNCCGKLIPMAVIGNIRFDNKLIRGEDSVFMVEISKNINNVLLASEDVIYYIRVREESASRSYIPFKKMFLLTIYEIRRYVSFFKWSKNKCNNIFILYRIAASVKSLGIYMWSKIF